MTSNKSVELSEQHQVIWCIARQTAVRPGSIGWVATRRENYLRWENVRFENLSEGRFLCIISFENLKTNYDDPEKGEARTLVCHLDSPNAENIVFSVPHRLLTLALRRKLLAGIGSVEELLSTRQANIRIKQQNRKDPVFYAGIPGGRGLNEQVEPDGSCHALSSAQISAFLSDRGRAAGYTSGITFSSFRRRGATDLVVRVGYEMTREIMGHAPTTRRC